MKKMCAAVGVGCASLAVIVSSAAAALPSFRSDLIVPNESIGGVKLGDTLPALKSALGASGKACTTGGCYLGTTSSGSMNVLMGALTRTATPRVIQITITAGIEGTSTNFSTPLAELKTADGIGIGSTAAAVHRAYPHALGSAKAGFEIKGHGEYGTEFTLSGGRVSGIETQSMRVG